MYAQLKIKHWSKKYYYISLFCFQHSLMVENDWIQHFESLWLAGWSSFPANYVCKQTSWWWSAAINDGCEPYNLLSGAIIYGCGLENILSNLIIVLNTHKKYKYNLKRDYDLLLWEQYKRDIGIPVSCGFPGDDLLQIWLHILFVNNMKYMD